MGAGQLRASGVGCGAWTVGRCCFSPGGLRPIPRRFKPCPERRSLEALSFPPDLLERRRHSGAVLCARGRGLGGDAVAEGKRRLDAAREGRGDAGEAERSGQKRLHRGAAKRGRRARSGRAATKGSEAKTARRAPPDRRGSVARPGRPVRPAHAANWAKSASAENAGSDRATRARGKVRAGRKASAGRKAVAEPRRCQARGWKVGEQGRKGEPGQQGEPGDQGEPGPTGPSDAYVAISDERTARSRPRAPGACRSNSRSRQANTSSRPSSPSKGEAKAGATADCSFMEGDPGITLGPSNDFRASVRCRRDSPPLSARPPPWPAKNRRVYVICEAAGAGTSFVIPAEAAHLTATKVGALHPPTP